MPGAEHEAISELVSLDPVRVAAFLTACVGVTIPTFAVARIADSNLSDRNPTTNHADNVLILEDTNGDTLFAVVFEIQRQPDSDKTYAWLLYLAMTRRRHNCPAMVVVIATTKRAAAFASAQIDTGHPGCTSPPWCGDLTRYPPSPTLPEQQTTPVSPRLPPSSAKTTTTNSGPSRTPSATYKRPKPASMLGSSYEPSPTPPAKP